VKRKSLGNLVRSALGAAALLVAGGLAPASAQNLPVMVGDTYDAAVAALKQKGIAFQESAADSGGKTIGYATTGEHVTLDFTMWPSDPAAPASSWEAGSSAARRLTLTHVTDAAPSSPERRAWVNTLTREGKSWAYLGAAADVRRPSDERSKYPVAAFLVWNKPPASLLFQAARAAGTPPGSEDTLLDIRLENPHKPRRF
jgi:hypothetical protein